MADKIAEELIRVITKHCPAEYKGEITLNTRLEETGVDSLTMSEIVFELEEVFDFSLPEPDGESGPEFDTVGHIYQALVKNLPASKGGQAKE